MARSGRGMFMRRREFVRLLGGAAAWPLAVRAQQPAKLPSIGFIGPSTASADRTRRAAFAKRLGELGWVEGRSIAIEYRWAEGVVARAGEIAAEYAQQEVDVIVVSGDAQVLAAKRATAVIPIVIAASADPAGNRLVEGLARPGLPPGGCRAAPQRRSEEHTSEIQATTPFGARLLLSKKNHPPN